MNELHFPTCSVWDTADIAFCNCMPDPGWRIRKDPSQPFPWRVFRRTSDGALEPLMGCSSWVGAIELVDSFAWLRRNGRELRNKSDA